MLYVICIVLVIAIASFAIPSDVWSLLLENSRDMRGRLQARYVWQESKAVGNFFAGFLLGAFVLTTLIVGAAFLYDIWYVSESGPAESSEHARHSLWASVPIAIVVVFTFLVLAIRLTSRGYTLAMDQLVVEAAARNRRKIASSYLQSTAQTNNQRWHRSDEADEES